MVQKRGKGQQAGPGVPTGLMFKVTSEGGNCSLGQR